MKYNIVYSNSKSELVNKIHEKLDSGWELQGGITAVCTENKIYTNRDSAIRDIQPEEFEYSQAIFKKDIRKI
jgi:hypothetical protein